MNSKKLKRIVAMATVMAIFLTNSVVSAATTTATTTTQEDETATSTTSTNSNVLNVNVDDNGVVNYSLPASKTTDRENLPFSWDNASVYFLITDRFVNGDKSNDHSYGRSVGEADAANYENREGTFHGGDLKGLTQKIEEGYFDDLGINAIWFTAPYEQIHGALTGTGFKHYAYHGYYALDFSEVDKNMGTAEDLENFVDTAHEHGIRVVMDVVMNHVGYADPVTANEYGFGKLASNWQDIYYNWGEKSYKWYNDYAGEAANNGSIGMMVYDGDWTSNWWGTDWIRAVSTRFKGYEGSESGDEITLCSSGLPDLKMESSKEVSLPPILVNKWKKEGTYNEKVADLNKWFASTGRSRTVSNYVVKWLSDYVRDYGIDGFRCDTAKHIPLSSWKALDEECEKALKEWRQNNPTKAGAQWTDDFWMTGEVWGNGLGNNKQYYSNGFNSLINFGYQGAAFSSYSSLEGTYSSYANTINSDSNYNVLSYISSHDKGLSRNTTENMIKAGTDLLLLPGGIQIYYGDETNRQAVGSNSEQSWRSQMNWDSIDTTELAHWQKVGTFRANHISVGAGTHKQISASPYTFSRVYYKNGVSDSVVCSLPGTAGTYDVQVGSVFSDGTLVRDAYSGETTTVSGGVATFTCDKNGVILVESCGIIDEHTLGINPSSDTTYTTDTVEVKLSCGDCVNGKYSINGGAAKSFTNGDKITIGKGLKDGAKTTITVTGTDKKSCGVEIKSKTIVLTKKVIQYDEGTLYVNGNCGWSGPIYAYIYDESGSTVKALAKWPGVEMTFNEEENRYVLELPDEYKTATTQVIFTNGSNQYPATRQPGEYYVVGKAMVFDGSQISLVNPTEDSVDIVPGTVTTSKASPQVKGTSITIKTTEATGGSGNFTYEFQVNGETIKDYSTSLSATWKPTVAGNYTIIVNCKDSDGNIATSEAIDYKITNPLTTFKMIEYGIDKTVVKAGDKVTMSANATGTGTIKYRFVAQKDGKTTFVKDYSTKKSVTWTPREAGTYKLYFKAKNTAGKVINKSISVTVEENASVLKINSAKVSSEKGQVGTPVTLTTEAVGGTGSLKYKFVGTLDGKTALYKEATKNTIEWTPSKAGTYKLTFRVTDTAGKTVVKTMNYVVEEAAGLKINSIKLSKNSPQAVGTSIKVTVDAQSSNVVYYKMWAYKVGGDWSLIKDFSTTNTATWKPTEAGNYFIWVDAMDSTGEVTSEMVTFTVK